MMMISCISMTLLLITGAQARLVFPPGSDVGYIVPDDPGPQKFEDDTSWLNNIDTEEYEQPLLQRGEREALNDVESAFWHAVEDSVKLDGRRSAQDKDKVDPIENWHGKWFPHAPQGVSANEDVPADLPDNMKDEKHGVTMGVPHAKCDTGTVNLTMDWDFSPINYTCYNAKHHRIPVQASLSSVEECVDLPKNYTPQHYCMNRKLTYNTTLPTYGPHRPLWPVFGEYTFVPVQRWLHSIEVYTCGECGKKIQGTVSIVQHLLAHDSDIPKPGMARYMTVVNGGESKDGEQLLVNGDHKGEPEGGEKSAVQPNVWMVESRLQNGSEEDKKCGDDEVTHDKLSFTGTEFKLVKGIPVLTSHEGIPVGHMLDYGSLLQNGSRESEMMENGNSEESLSCSGTHQEPLQVEINPLDLLTTVIEEDQKSENPILPAEHFLLSLPTPTHFLEGEVGGQEDSVDGFQDGQENEDDGSNDGFSDIPSDILLESIIVINVKKPSNINTFS